MIKATDDEIREFFTTTIFEGIYSKEIKSKNTSHFKGHIHSIRINGEPTNVIGSYINVSNFANDIPEGECTFKCRTKEEVRTTPSQINFYQNPKSLRSKMAIVQEPALKDGELCNKDLFELWGVDDCECIGFFHADSKSDGYIIDDLRKPNFDRIPPYLSNKKQISLWLKYLPNGIELDNYYRFTWRLSHKNEKNPYEIFFDSRYPTQEITPKWFIDKLFEDRHSDKSKNFGSAANFLDTLSKQLSAKESTFVYELLQNANDYPVEGEMVDVEFYITDDYLLFMHSGEKFNVRNISGICGINEKEKVANKKTIGYKGIGFKTVFLNNHYVYLRTGEYSFRFDEGETPEKKLGGKIKRQDAPFQILPIWTEHNEVAPEVNSVFDNADKKFNVQIALRPEDKNILHIGKDNYEYLFKDIFSDSNIILFIPNINSVKVFISGKEERVCFRNSEKWIVSDYEETISPDLQEAINITIDKGNSRIPEKYKDFDCTKVSFACNHEGTMIKPVDNAIIYCYLPTKASWGFPFLMNTDMIPKGDRDDIEKEVKLVNANESNFNEELAAIAGDKFFCWIKDLLTSKKYQLGSVFSLIPDFKKCKKENHLYTNFIEQFECTFNKKIETDTIVPIRQDIANVKKVILDTTGLSTSGIMTDDEFCKFTGMQDYYLPLPVLRKDKSFKAFLKRYVDEEQRFEEDNLRDLISNEDFKEWLQVQDNNNKFLNFLLEDDYLEKLLDEEIFLDADGELYAASDLYYNIDKELEDLQAFSDHLSYLSSKTREYFSDKVKWNEVIEGAFAKFDADDFIDKTLLSRNRNETKERLKNKNTSIHFYKFLAENVSFDEDYLNLPFISDNNEVVDDFCDKFIFFSSIKGHKVFDYQWLSNVEGEFLSNDYTDVTKAYFEKNFKVRKFSDEVVAKEIILSEDHHDDIETEIANDFDVNKSFVYYCYAQKSIFESSDLRKYSLFAYNGNGENVSSLTECNIYFDSNLYDYYAAKEWIDDDWMYVIDKDYYTEISELADFKKFLDKIFWVRELTEERFYKNVVRENITDVFKNTSGNLDPDGTKNVDFVRYLNENYELIFVVEKDYDKFSEFKPISNEGSDLSLDDNVYVYDEELADIANNSWFPKDIVCMCTKEYGESKSLERIGCKKYKFGEFYDDVIVENITVINEAISSKEESVAFHNFIISKLGSLTTDQQEKMSKAMVYLYGQDEPVDGAKGHTTLSANAKELFELGLVDFADLDIIDPDYEPEKNVEYWENRLGNSKFTVNNFFTWMKDNLSDFQNTLLDEKLNLAFWRWLKDTDSAQPIDQLSSLPLLLKNGEIDANGPIYFSDEYMEGAGIENSIKRYDSDTNFLSPRYITEDDNIGQWKSLFSNVGVKFDIIDILVGTIIPQLSDIQDENLPKLIAKHREALEGKYEDGLISHLKDLLVKAHDGNFYDISKVIYIDCEKDEPFPYIELPNQISFDSADERRLAKEILEEIDCDIINSLSEWQKCKLDYYLKLQGDDDEKIRPYHYRLINDLAAIRNSQLDSLKEIDHVDEIRLLNKDGEFCKAEDLTMGSVYNPFFDFEACGITSLDYVSDAYQTECAEYVGKLFRSMKTHCDFQEEDIDFLEGRDCAIYFWSKYLTKKEYAVVRIPRIKQFIIDGKFNNIKCIPTKDCMKCASDLYYGNEVSRYFKNIEDAENKTPLSSIPDVKLDGDETLFGKLPFKASLDFLDALYALINVSGQDRRSLLLRWMIDSYDKSYDNKIDEYREDENALWLNNKNEKVQIKDLYALDYNDKLLEQYFGQNPRIANKDYFPAGDFYKEICDILRINTITSDDLKMEPVGDSVYKSCDNDHKLYALVIAGLIDSDNWQKLYMGYCEKLNELTLHKCDSILITYSEDSGINQNLKKFYHKPDSNDFYFVDDLDGKRVFRYFVDAFMEFLNIDAKRIAKDVVEDIMDCSDNALEVAKDQNNLMLDEEFKEELDKLIPGIKRELLGNEAKEYDEENINHRPTFTTFDGVDEESSEEQNKPYEGVEQTSTGETQNGKGFDHDDGHSTIEDETTKSQKEPPSPSEPEHQYESNFRGVKRDTQGRKQSSPAGNQRRYDDMSGWEGRTRTYSQQKPKQYSPDDVRNFGSHGIPMELEVLEPTKAEIDKINTLLGEDLTPEEIADHNYLAQLRLYYNLANKGLTPEESIRDFVRNAHLKNEHTLHGGKYIHKCSAAGGIMYLSPSIWNKIEDDRCIVCVYLGAKANEFKYFNSIADILECIGKDDIIIKLTGKEKADVMKTLYSGVLEGVKGTAYTLIRIKSNEKYNSVFAPLAKSDVNAEEEKEEDY